MKEHIGRWWSLYSIVFVIAIVGWGIVKAEKARTQDKKQHAAFMVEKNCVIDLGDKTLGRVGCMTIDEKIFWRK